MLLDLVKKPHKSEPKPIFTFRRVVILSLVVLLFCLAVLLFLRMLAEQTTYAETLLSTSSSSPMPDIYLSWDQPFVIDCYDQTFTNTTCSSSILQPTYNNITNLARPYIGAFVSNISLREGEIIGLYIYATDKSKVNESLFYIIMNAFDQEYDPNRPNFTTGKDDLFDQSLVFLNQYFLSGNSYSYVHYSRILRETIKNSALNYLGFLSSYNTQKIVDSTFQVVDYNYTGAYARVEFSPGSFIMTEQKEQRTNNVMTLAGTICAYYGFIIAVYTCLFGTGILNPWGVVQNGCCGMYKKKFKYSISSQTASMMEYGNIEKRIKHLEEFQILLQENVLDTSLLETGKRGT